MVLLGHPSLVCLSTCFHKNIRIKWQKRSLIRPHKKTVVLLFCFTQKVLTSVVNLCLSLYFCICLTSKQKTDVIVLTGITDNSGDTIMSIALIRFLCILGIKYTLGNRQLLIGMLLMPNSFSTFLIFSSIISFARKLLILV